jgi:hypothetical protein
MLVLARLMLVLAGLTGVAQAGTRHLACDLPPNSLASVLRDSVWILRDAPVGPGGILEFTAEGSGFFRILTQGGDVDTVPPGKITDLEVAESLCGALRLAWTAPGDDGDDGTAAAFYLRRSRSPITNQSWSSALPVPALPAPRPAGTRQEVRVGELGPSERWYFAIRARDEADNLSVLSNPAMGTTPSSDDPECTPHVEPPDSLRGSVFEGSVVLRWRASPDTSVVGYRAYRIRQEARPPELLGSTEALTFVHPHPDSLGACLYSVTALSREGRESEPAGPVRVDPGPAGQLVSEMEFETSPDPAARNRIVVRIVLTLPAGVGRLVFREPCGDEDSTAVAPSDPALLVGVTRAPLDGPGPHRLEDRVPVGPGRHRYWIAERASSGHPRWIGSHALAVSSSADEPVAEPAEPRLLALHPNPTSGPMRLAWQSHGVEPVRLAIYDMAGREVGSASLDAGPGRRERLLDVRSLCERPLAAGLYTVRVRIEHRVEVRRIVILP